MPPALPQPSFTSKPAEGEQSHTDHGEHEAVGLLFQQTHGAAAGRADIVGHGSIRLRLVHAKSELVPGAKIACLRSGGNILGRIVDDQSVRLRKKRVGASGLIFAGIPNDRLRRLEGHVG